MNRLTLGQFGKFDYEKQKRDYRENFWGIEACSFENEGEVDKLLAEAEQCEFNIGVHFPIRAGRWKLRDPQPMSENAGHKYESYKYAEEEVEFIKKMKPKYILFHYPKPAIIVESFDRSKWRFEEPSEYAFESEYSFEKFKKESDEFFRWLYERIVKAGIVPIIELDALNKYIYDTNIVEELLQKYKGIRICLDFGRISLQEKVDENFDPYKLVEKFSEYTDLVHLWNVNVKDTVKNNHYPALPKLKPEDGWGDIEGYFKILCSKNNDFRVLFEHRSDLISDEELESCYTWVESMIKE